MGRSSKVLTLAGVLGTTWLVACGDEAIAGNPVDGGAGGSAVGWGDASPGDAASSSLAVGAITYRSQVPPITRVADALPGVFIPPFENCQAPLAGEPAGQGADGKVCTNVMISACTEPGRYYPSFADCSVVRRQRPYWSAPPAKVPPASDPRLSDTAYLADLAWAKEQIAASGCTCCHDSRAVSTGPSQWDINAGPLWLDTLSDPGLSLFAGFADSTVLGAYPKEENHGFDRTLTGVPSTDSARMQRIMRGELTRRGISEATAKAVPPFGGPIYANSVKVPVACGPGQGVAPDGTVQWTGGNARYVYVLAAGGRNPGVPPNFDIPPQTVWRVDVLASRPAVASGLPYGTTPAGVFQTFPASTPAPKLTIGTTYQLFVELDMGLPITNCTFTFGQPVVEIAKPMAAADAGTGNDGGYYASADGGQSATTCSKPGPDGDPRGIGVTCTVSGLTKEQCPCAADQCSKSPFETSGYCTMSGCDVDPSVCPAGWKCSDLSAFVGMRLSICLKP